MDKSGFCMWPAQDGESHNYCTTDGCKCNCHEATGGSDD